MKVDILGSQDLFPTKFIKMIRYIRKIRIHLRVLVCLKLFLGGMSPLLQICNAIWFYPRFLKVSVKYLSRFLFVRVFLILTHSSVLQVDYSIIASQAGATLNNLMSHAQDLVAKLRSLQFDQREFVCLKFLVLFSLGKASFSHTLYNQMWFDGAGLCVCWSQYMLFSTKILPSFSNDGIVKCEYITCMSLHDSSPASRWVGAWKRQFLGWSPEVSPKADIMSRQQP